MTIGLTGICVACVPRGWILNVGFNPCSERPPSSLPELTPNGFQCDGECHNRCNSVLCAVRSLHCCTIQCAVFRHNNRESLAPRCTIVDPAKDPLGLGMDYCSNCQVKHTLHLEISIGNSVLLF